MIKKKDQFEIELFKNFQHRKNLYDDIISFTVSSPLFSQEPKGMDFFSILLFESGSGTHTINSVEYPIQPHQLHMLHPGQVHSWNIHGDVKIHAIFVSGKLVSRFGNYYVYPVEFYKVNPVFNLSEEGYERLYYEFVGVIKEVEKKYSLREIVFSRLRIIAMIVSREAESKFIGDKMSTQDYQISRFILLVHGNFRSQRKVKFYAENLMITANYLNILCRKFLGMTATQFISQQIINEMKSEMLISNKSIKQIASEMNFIDLSTFSTYFKSNTGMSPSEYINFNKEIG
ncbi:MAG: helix-turn-helix transcriptional regulator [Sphingobacterium sp.]|jgi:AraC-like DNA-binding protein|nr:helix-turn-helix transcriptional regulator [Sphingobacterium sp.]